MQVKFKVHRASWHQAPRTVTLASGEKVTGDVREFQVELVSDEHGTITLRYAGAEAESAAKVCRVGAVVTGSFGVEVAPAAADEGASKEGAADA